MDLNHPKSYVIIQVCFPPLPAASPSNGSAMIDKRLMAMA